MASNKYKPRDIIKIWNKLVSKELRKLVPQTPDIQANFAEGGEIEWNSISSRSGQESHGISETSIEQDEEKREAAATQQREFEMGVIEGDFGDQDIGDL